MRTASAQQIMPIAACTARVVIQNILYTVEFVVLPSCSHDVILGWDFLSRHHAVIRCAPAEVEFSPLLEDSFCAPNAKVVIAEDTVVQPRSSVLVPLCCTSIPEATVLFTPSDIFFRRRCVPLPLALLTIRNGASAMMITNQSTTSCALLHGETLGFVESVDPRLVTELLDDAPHLQVDELSATTPCTRDETCPEIFCRSIDENLDATQRAQLTALLSQFSSSFDSGQSSLGRTSVVSHAMPRCRACPTKARF